MLQPQGENQPAMGFGSDLDGENPERNRLIVAWPALSKVAAWCDSRCRRAFRGRGATTPQ